jgi:hypothetical protein
MTRCINLAAALALLLMAALASTAAIAADKPLYTCTDGAQTSAKHLCGEHGGVKGSVPNANGASKPIDTTKGLTPPTKTATTSKSKTSNKSASASKRTGGPTAKCNDGALYYSTEHKGACLSHGGVDKWYIW